METITDHQYLSDFWGQVVRSGSGRTWQLATLIDGDLALRDGFAHALVRSSLAGRDDIHYRFVQAWMGDPEPTALSPGMDVLFIGRPKPFAASWLSVPAACLERRASGRFIDPNNGKTGNSIRYERNYFSRHELEEPFGRYHRCDRDYGLLLYRLEDIAGDVRRLVAIGGLGTLGTLGLVIILASDEQRKKLQEEARALAPWRDEYRPDQWMELCVRIEVKADVLLDNLLNEIGSRGEDLPFEYCIEAMAFAKTDGTPALHLRSTTEPMLDLRQRASGRGGYVRLEPSGPWIRLPKARFGLLKWVKEHREEATTEELCWVLGYEKHGKEPSKNARTSLAKLVHDVNDMRIGGCRRLLRYSKTLGRYILCREEKEEEDDDDDE